MEWVYKMDAVLYSLHEFSGENPNFNAIRATLPKKDISDGEILDIFLYLWREGLIYCEVEGNRNHTYIDLPDSRFLMSCKGKLFVIEYTNFSGKDRIEKLKLKNLETDVQIRKTNERLISRGTIWLAVGTFLLVLVETLIHREGLKALF